MPTTQRKPLYIVPTDGAIKASIDIATRPLRGLPPEPLAMPTAAMYGKLGELAQSLEAPLGWAYCATLGALAGLQQHSLLRDEDLAPNLYVCLLGRASDGKSATMRRALRLFFPKNEDYMPPPFDHEAAIAKAAADAAAQAAGKKKPRKGRDDEPHQFLGNPHMMTTALSSERALYTLFQGMGNARNPHYAVLVQDEFSAMIRKMNIPNATLAQSITQMFYDTAQHAADKEGQQQIWVRLSILGCLAIEDTSEFRQYFAASSRAGLYDRFIYAPGPEEKHYFDHSFEGKTHAIKCYQVTMSSDLKAQIVAWEKTHIARKVKVGRIPELIKRVAVLSASANRDPAVTQECLDAALLWGEWQLKVRNKYFPGVGLSADAEIYADIVEAIEPFVHPVTGEPQWFRFTTLAKQHNWYRKYPTLLTRVRDTMLHEGLMEAEYHERSSDEEQRNVRPRKTGRYRMVRDDDDQGGAR